jgi:acid phosphatase type 7
MPAAVLRCGAPFLCVLVALVAAPGADAARVVKVLPTADSSVRADRPRTSYGRLSSLRVGGRPAGRVYLRFRIRGLRGRLVRSASLWVYVIGRDWRGVEARPAGPGAWSERRLTWRSRPSVGRPAVGRIAAARGRWKRVDVTTLVHANGTVEIALTGRSRRAVLLASREAGRRRAPRLHLSASPDRQPGFPIRAAFYVATYPPSWQGPDVGPLTRYHPLLDAYDGAADSVIRSHMAAMRWGAIEAGLASWDGPETPADTHARNLLASAGRTRSSFRWAARVSAEVGGTPSPSEISTQLGYLDASLGRDRSYLRIRGRPVVFVDFGPTDGCGAARRWLRGNFERTYLVLPRWPGYRACRVEPSDWFQAAPDQPEVSTGRRAFAISPGSFRADSAAPALTRNLARWYANVRNMVGSGARWQLVSSFNDWADGTAIEPASEWASPSGFGHYLDALRVDGAPPEDNPVVLAAAGDIACDPADPSFNAGHGRDDADNTKDACMAGRTADVVLALNPSLVLPLGDDQYERGQLAAFEGSYDPSWGRFKDISRPVPGNHEYSDPAGGAAGYFDYFGGLAGPRGQGWYSYDVSGWHVIALNSECQFIGGCGSGSAQELWLRQDLAAHPAACTLAYWHRPLFSGGREGERTSMRDIWRDLYQAGAEVVLSGHNHDYERFLPQAPDRAFDPSGGIQEIVAGTGGKSHIQPVRQPANTVVQNADTYGVLRLVLRPLGWDWQFVPAPGGGGFTDGGSGDCH